MATNKKDREISLVWNGWNTAFREGYCVASRGEPNPGNVKGTGRERGLHYGWTRKMAGLSLPVDPLWVTLGAYQLVK